MSLHEENQNVCSADWLDARLDQFRTDDPDYRLVEVDMDPAVYDDWHIPGAEQINWEEDIITGLGGNVIDADEASSLFGSIGITEETTVVLYGDRANWFAGHAYWVLTYYNHEDVNCLGVKPRGLSVDSRSSRVTRQACSRHSRSTPLT